jgi:hypothetical protein
VSRNETPKTEDTSVTNAPRPWSLGEEAPEPQTIPAPRKATDAQVKASRRGVDPLGRAIGPKEDPSEIKRVHDIDGKIVTPDAKTGTTPAQRKAEAAAKKTAIDAAAKQQLEADKG